MYEIKKYNKKDFPILIQFFKDWEWSLCDERTIAQNAFFVTFQDKPIAFSNFAITDTNVSILGFTISDKNTDKKILSEGLDILLIHIFNTSKELGFEYMHYATDNAPMVKRLERLGLMQVTDNATGYLMTGSLTGKSIAFFDE
jgi:hypothetical protein